MSADPLRERLAQLAKEMRAVAITAAMPPTPFDREEVGRRCAEWAERIEAALRAVPVGELTVVDVQAVWRATFDRDDWAHIVAFANAVRRLEPARPVAPEEK